MKKILLISDTHSLMDDKILHYAKLADEVWHAGDWGEISVYNKLKKACDSIRGVYGNIDGQDIRNIFEEDCVFTIEGIKVFITHIGGYPTKYVQRIKPLLKMEKPKLYICGHSHILKVMRDSKLDNMLHINPGAAGIYGFHQIRTWLTFEIDKGIIKNLNVIESNKNLHESI